MPRQAEKEGATGSAELHYLGSCHCLLFFFSLLHLPVMAEGQQPPQQPQPASTPQQPQKVCDIIRGFRPAKVSLLLLLLQWLRF